VNIGDSASLELADKFCYLDDMLSVDRDNDAAMKATVQNTINLGSWCLDLLIRTFPF